MTYTDPFLPTKEEADILLDSLRQQIQYKWSAIAAGAAAGYAIGTLKTPLQPRIPQIQYKLVSTVLFTAIGYHLGSIIGDFYANKTLDALPDNARTRKWKRDGVEIPRSLYK